MAEHKGKYRTIYLVTAALMVAMIGGYALAATTVTTLNPQQSSNVTNTPTPGGFGNIGAVSSEQLVILSAAMTATATAGTQTGGTIGLSGTPTALANCAAAPCTASNFRDASQGAQTTGNYGEQIVVDVSQPGNAGTSIGFDFSITVVASTGTIVAQGYLATGVSTGAGTETIPVFVFVDLTTTTAPVIDSLTVVFNQCSSATACP
jgi:hypothetical protein